jgi:leucyl-tRNA synthetase
MKYNPIQIEAKYWATIKLQLQTTVLLMKYKTKTLCFDMFPYPSGAGLHVTSIGIASDVYSRYKDIRVMFCILWVMIVLVAC